MRTTTTTVANAIRSGVRANFAPPQQHKELERISELFVDMAASIEQTVELDEQDGQQGGLANHANVLATIGDLLDETEQDQSES
jgi:hypothetical protein